jgi:hypothetical protein
VMGFLRQSLANYLLGAIFPPQSSWSLPPEELGLQVWVTSTQPLGIFLQFRFLLCKPHTQAGSSYEETKIITSTMLLLHLFSNAPKYLIMNKCSRKNL